MGEPDGPAPTGDGRVTGVAPGIRRVLAPNPGPMTLDGTNTYVLDSRDGAVVVDPGPLDEGHLRRVAGLGPVVLVLLTHRHPDHADGAARLVELAGGVDVLDRSALDTDGEDLGVPGRVLRVLHTPGHTGDSVCFVVDDDGTDRSVVLTGDTILGRGTTVVAWPDGHLGDYLASLERLRDLRDPFGGAGDLLALPGHGPVLPSLRDAAGTYLRHRHDRLEQVRAAVAAGCTTPEQVVARVYAGVDRSLWPAAGQSVRAQLDHLRSADGSATGGGTDRSGDPAGGTGDDTGAAR